MPKFKTAKASLCFALLEGRVLNVKNCFELIGLTNCSREISRMVEKDFEVEVSRTQMKGESRYGQTVTWVNFRLNKTEHNKKGIEKMYNYVDENLIMPSGTSAKAIRGYVQSDIFNSHQKENYGL